MLLSDFSSLKKYLTSGPSASLSRAYLLAILDDYERGKAAKEVISFCLSEGSIPYLFNGSDLLMRDLYDALNSPPLFGGESVVFVDEVEKMGKKELQELASRIAAKQFFGYLILGARAKTALFSPLEKGGVVLDLTDEKPWIKDKRMAEQIHLRVQNGGKRLGSDVAPLLFERVGSDGALLDQEIDKLICFVGERPTIERADVFRLTPSSRTETFWKIAEEIVWERVFHSASDAFYALIPALRSQLQLGKKIGSLHAAGIAKEKWPDYLAKIWPKTLEKRSAQALQLGAAYFQRGLQALFEIERLSRTGSTREEALFDLFQINLISYVPR